MAKALLLLLFGLGVASAANCATSLKHLTVATASDVSELRDSVSCEGGNVVATWSGKLKIDDVITVGNSTALEIIGIGHSSAMIQGAGYHRLFNLLDYSVLTLDGMTLTGGNPIRVHLPSSGYTSYSYTPYFEKSSTYTYVATASSLEYGLSESHTHQSVSGYNSFYGGEAISIGGGAIHAWHHCTLTITNCRFHDNFAGDGGAVYMRPGATLNVTDSVFENNMAPSIFTFLDGGWGGAIYMSGVRGKPSEAHVQNCSFLSNKAYRGGAVGMGSYANATFFRNIFSGNEASEGGAAAFNEATGTFVGDSFSNNTAAYNGGAVLNEGGTIKLESAHLSYNSAQYGGAIRMDFDKATTDISRSTFEANQATVTGGAIYANFFKHLSATLTVFDSNTALSAGGAIYALSSGDIRIDSCDIQSNAALARGGALVLSATAAVITDARFVNNTAPGVGSVCELSYSPTTISGSVIEDRTSERVAVMFALGTELNMSDTVVRHIPPTTDFQPYAMLMSTGTSATFQNVTFVGWDGDYVVYDGGKALHADDCAFEGCSASAIIEASLAKAPAVVRNARVDTTFYSAASYSIPTNGFATNAALCADVCDSSEPCVDSEVGALCVCYSDAITGSPSVCLGDSSGAALVGATVDVPAPSAFKASATSSSASNGQYSLETSLNITAVSDVIWNVSVVASIEGVAWSAVPTAGILLGGETMEVLLTAHLSEAAAESASSGFSSTATVTTYSAAGSATTSETFDSFFSICDAEFYFDPTSGECKLCSTLEGAGADGVNCMSAGISLYGLPLNPGYWRVDKSSTIIEECYVPQACDGGTFVGDQSCADGYEGPYCAVCANGYSSGIGYHCHACNKQLKAGIIVLLAFVGILLLGLATFTLYQGFGTAAGAAGSVCSIGSSLGAFGASVAGAVKFVKRIPFNTLRIPVVVFQIITQFTVITGVIYPPIYSNFVAFLGLINLDFGWILNVGCLHSFNYYDTLLIVTLLPIALLAALCISLTVSLKLVQRRPIRQVVGPMRTVSGSELKVPAVPEISHQKRRRALVKRVIRKHIKIAFVVSFLIYTTVSTVCFQAFRCDPVGETRYLRADYSLECSGSKYNANKIYAAVMIVLYPIGIPALYVWSLWRYRQDFQRVETSFQAPKGHRTRTVSFLWKPYTADRFWWECVECGRRLLLTGFLVFIFPNTGGQTAIACLFAVSSLAVFALYSPLKERTDTVLYITGCITIFFTMFMGLLIKVQAASEDSQSQKILAVMLIVLNVAILAIAGGQCVLVASGMRQAMKDSAENERVVSGSSAVLHTAAFESSELESGEAKVEKSASGEAEVAEPSG